MFEILRETCKRYFNCVGVCCCLQTCNSVFYVLEMWLLLGQSLMVISVVFEIQGFNLKNKEKKNWRN